MSPRKTPKAEVNAFAHSLLASPWAITDEGRELLMRAALSPMPARAELEAIEKERGSRLSEDCPGVTIKDGVATVRIMGPLFRYENIWSYWFGWSTYQQLAYLATTLRRRADVSRILYDYDTPGGEVNGIGELARILFEGRDEKPQEGHASGLCCSAGYWIASAIGRLSCADLSIVGSIGVMSTFYDDAEFLKLWGFERHEFRSRQSPRKNLSPLTRAGEADYQRTLDDLGAVFIRDVAEFRGVTEAHVLEHYGQGAVFVGAAAVTAGLADQLTTYERLHQELVKAQQDPTSPAAAGAIATPPAAEGRPTTTPEITVQTGKGKAGGGANPVAEEEQEEEHEQDPSSEEQEQDDEEEEEEEQDETVGRTTPDPVAAERARVKGILALQRSPAEKKIIDACIDDPKCSVADAALKLRQAEPARGARSDKLKAEEAAVTTPTAGAGAGSESDEVANVSDSIVNAGKAAVKAR